MKLLDKLLSQVPSLKVSDVHIAAGMPPMARKMGLIKPVSDKALSAERTKAIIMEILSDKQKAMFEELLDLDFCYQVEGVGRFRVNILHQKDGVNGVFRYIPFNIPTPEEVGLSDTIMNLTKLHQGLVLVTGGTRNGKTTTLASMVEHINQQESTHIITIEDPIEFVYPSAKALINQREVGSHTQSTSNALRAALREDPDIIIVGEMRDAETIQLAISAAETGHLVISTLQTRSAHKTIDRIVDSFPANQVSQIRAMLSESLRGVVSQQLVPRKDGSGMILATEVLVATTSLSTLIKEGKTFQIPSIMQTGRALGMRKMDDALNELFLQDQISQEMALKYAVDKKAIGRVPAGSKGANGNPPQRGAS